jgi:hypothetical protein
MSKPPFAVGLAAFASFAITVPAMAGPGADFCIALQDKSVACVTENEATATPENARTLPSCPKAAAALDADYKAAYPLSPERLKDELHQANAAFLGSTKAVVPQPGEPEAEYLAHIADMETALLDACIRLRKADTAF